MLSPFQHCTKDIKGTSKKYERCNRYHSKDSNTEPSECEEMVAINRDILADVNGDLTTTSYFTFPNLICGTVGIQTDNRVDPRHAGALGRLIICRRLNPIVLKLFGPRTGLGERF